MNMDDFCGSDFWDWELTWNGTDNPDFTPCFENTILAWIPGIFLLLFSAMDIYYSLTSRAKNVPWSSLNVTKSLMLVALAILDLILLYNALSSIKTRDGVNEDRVVYSVEIYTPIIKATAYVWTLGLLLFSKVRGVRSSGVQFIFSLLLFCCEAIKFRTSINSRHKATNEDIITYTIEVIYFPITVGLFFLSCWADVKPVYQQDTRIVERPCPEESSSYINRILFHWYGSMAWKGFRKPLEYTDLWDLNTEDRSRVLVPIFDKYWSQDLNKKAKNIKPESSSSFGKSHGSVDIKFKRIKGERKTEKQYTSIIPALMKSFGATFFFGSALKLIPDLLMFVSPQILNLLIAYVSEGGQPFWKGLLYATLMFAAAFLQTLITAQFSHRMYMTAMRVRTVLVSAVYRKALLLSNAAKRESTVGEIVNLMSADVQRIMDLIPFVNMIWSAPLQIAVALYFLWGILGPASLAGLVVMVLLLPANAVIANIGKKLQQVQMKNKDQRVKLVNEILSGIKVLKLYAWEPSFENQIMNIRGREMDVLKKAAYLSAVTNFLWMCAPFLVALCSFAAFVLSDDKNVLDAQKAFVALSLFNIMSLPLTFLPMIIVFMVQAYVSVNRLNKYMNAEEIDPEAVTHDSTENEPIVIENGCFSWESDSVVLKNINLKIKEGSLVAVVGTVGSGKSSLLSAMLGELEKSNGRVNTKGSIGYVAQQAWIQNATLRDNILFGKPYDSHKYEKVVNACALKPDLEILPAGDKTEIGEKGINLSGGQKQRVSLARSTYNNADVYLLDDPLSAVDSHVGKHIFEKVIGPKGMLKRKTRVLVTHGIAFLPQMDNIVVMKDGEISEIGTYQELLDKKGAFAEFLTQRITSEEDIDDIADDSVLKGLEQVVGPLEQIRKRRKSEATASESEGGQKSIRIDSPGTPVSDRRRLSSTNSRRSSKTESTSAVNKLIEVEKTETKSVKFAVYMDYFRAAGWGLSIATFFLYMIFQGFSVGSNMWLSVWSNEPIVNGTQDAGKRDMFLAVYGVFGFLQAFSILAATIVMALGTLKSAAVLHHKMLSRILQAPMWFFDTTPVGRIVNRFAKDVDTADNTLPFNIRLWLNSFFQVVATLVIISYSTPIFIAVIIPISGLYYFIQRFYVSTSRQLRRLESVTRSPIYSHFGETITGSSTIRAYGQQDRFILESEAKVDHNQIAYFPAITSNRWLQVRLETLGNSIIFFAALFAVLGRETLDSGMVGLSVSYALQITIALNMLVRWTSDVETNIVAVERLKEYGDAPQEAPWQNEQRKPTKYWPEKGEVIFDHYQTRYRPGLDLVLRDVTCKIEPMEKIGIVGRTGAGKSSLTLGLFRIVEAAGGSITIDGHNISKLGLHDLRSRITIIPQDPVLFSGTLRINLDPFETHTDDEVWRALELGHLKTYAQGLSTGLQHEISEGGENLSVGQRQLVCLARALLRKTKILVLDEATAAVDLETDDLIQATIRKEFKDSTVITIAHRLNTIMDSTRIIVLDKGEIREFDTPEELLKKKSSIFYSMAKDAGIVH